MKIRTGRLHRHHQLVGAPRQNGQHVVGAEEGGLRSLWGRRRIIDTEEPEAELGSVFYTDLDTGFATFDVNRDRFTATERVFNDGALDQDFRVEGTVDPNLLTVDAGINKVGVGGVPTTEKFEVFGNTRVTGDMKWLSGTGSLGSLEHTNTAPRVYLFQDADGIVAFVDDIPTTEEMQDLVGAMLVDTGRIDFTYNDPAGTFSADIVANSVTFAFFQQIATDRLLGRDTAGAGNAEEISVGGGVEFTGGPGLQTSAFTGDVTKAAGGTVQTIPNDTVTFAKMQNLATDSLVGRDTAGAGDPESILLNATLEFDGAGNIRRAALTGDVTAGAGSNAMTIAADAVSNTKLSNMNAWTFKIRNNAAAGDPSDAALADITTEGSPAGGMFAVGFLSTGEIRKFDIAAFGGGGGYTDEMARDAIAAFIQNGTGISWVHNDAGDTLTPTVTLAPFTTGDLAEGANLYFTNERVDDRVAALLLEGAGIDLTYDDVANTLTIASTITQYTDEMVDDRVSVLIQNGTGITWSYNDGAGTLTPTVTITQYTDEMAQDTIATLIQNGTGISWVYSDAGNTLTPTVTLAPFSTTNLAEGANLYFTDERAQDAVGGILTDTARIDMVYNDGANTIAADLIADSVTFAFLQNIATDRLLGRDTAASGDIEELTVGGNIEFTGAGGIQRGALTGDVTAAAGSGATTIANDAVSNAKLTNMAPWTVKLRNAGTGGDPSDADLAALSEETVPAAGDFFFMFLATGEIVKVNWDKLPSSGGGISTIKLEDAVTVAAAVTIDFDGRDFLVTDEGGGEGLIQTLDKLDIHAWSTPSQITGNVDDYAFTGGDPDKTGQRLDLSANWNMSGIAAKPDGWIYILVNSVANRLTIKHDNTGSSAANRIMTGSGADYTLQSKSQCMLIYDSTSSRWRMFASLYSASGALLDGVLHTDTSGGSPTRGAVIVGSATPTWQALTLGAGGKHFVSDGTDAFWGFGSGDVVYAPTPGDTAINSVTDVNIVSQDITGVAAGDQVIIEADFIILNNSGAGRAYVITIDYDGAFDIEFTTGSLAASATLMHPFTIRSVTNIRSTSLAYQVNRVDGGPIAGIAGGGDVTMAATGLDGTSWATTGSNLTGTLTCKLAIRSASATATQTCRLVGFSVRKISPIS